MRNPANPFTDPSQVRGPLYAADGRLARRTSALHRARVSGRHAADVIADLAAEAIGTRPALIADIGCGRGTTTRALAERYPQASVIAVDLSAALLVTARNRLPTPGRTGVVRADFHRLPLPAAGIDVAVAAFCLYHSAAPAAVIAEMTRVLIPDGTAIIVVKSADSYGELDRILALSGLDPAAEKRPSLYSAAHSGNIADLAGTTLNVRQVLHEAHRFTFPTLADAAGYLVTSPKYDLPAGLTDDPAVLAAALRARVPDQPVTATSTVTYVTATRPPAGEQA